MGSAVKSKDFYRGKLDWYERVTNLSEEYYINDVAVTHFLLQERLSQLRKRKRFHFYATKRIFDLVFALVSIFLFLPVLLVIAYFVKVQDGGPVLFRHKRVGINGSIFNALKFRSMTVSAENVLLVPAMYAKSGNDPRVTKFGRILRNYKLDELPQLWNVVRGEMSIVGPRPASVEDVSTMKSLYWDRLALRPGITGLWQANISNKSPALRKIKLDRAYIRKASFALDVGLILKTFKIVILGESNSGK